MKIYRVPLLLFVAFTLMFVSTQVLASSVGVPNAQNASTTKTPGAKATEKAGDNATKQAEKVEDQAIKQANKEDKQKGKREHFKGTVDAYAANSSITLILRDGSSVTIGLTADTRIKFPGPKNSIPASIQRGMTASVQAIRDENDQLVASMVMVIPGKPGKIHRVGIVTEYTGTSITIQDKDGNTYTFTITGEMKLLPAERAPDLDIGSRVTIIAPRDPATGGVTVTGIVIHPAKP